VRNQIIVRRFCRQCCLPTYLLPILEQSRASSADYFGLGDYSLELTISPRLAGKTVTYIEKESHSVFSFVQKN